MEMINVLQRLAELDAKNPNVQQTALSENTQVSECGMMADDMHGSMAPHTPASMHITANDGQELGGILRDIMQLAGVKSSSTDLGDEPQVLSTTPVVGTSSPAADDMRSVIDKLDFDDTVDTDIDDQLADYDDLGDDDLDDEDQLEAYDNSPAAANSAQRYDVDPVSHHPNAPGAAKNRGLMANPRGVPTMEKMERQLYRAYQQYLNETK